MVPSVRALAAWTVALLAAAERVSLARRATVGRSAAQPAALVQTLSGNGKLRKEEFRSVKGSKRKKEARSAKSCELMLLTSIFTTRADWQLQRSFDDVGQIAKLCKSAAKHGVKGTALYDDERIVGTLRNSCANFNFQRVNLSAVDERFSPHDARFFLLEQLVQAHPFWEAVFMVDAFDVRVGMNPCLSLEEDVLYIGDEQFASIRGGGQVTLRHSWLGEKFERTGGAPWEWYKNLADETKGSMAQLNCGVIGGRRGAILRFLRRVREEMLGLDLSQATERASKVSWDNGFVKMVKGVRSMATGMWAFFGSLFGASEEPARLGPQTQFDMPVTNYVVHTDFRGRFHSGEPVNSKFTRYEDRDDVFFMHK